MPIYEYQCSSCESQYEKIVALGTASVPCPTCSEPGNRVMSAFAQVDRPKKGTVHYERDVRRQKGLPADP